MPETNPFQRTFQHAMEIWFLPEIKKRQESGQIPNTFVLHAAQLITFPDERPKVIRLNEEVAITAKARIKPGVQKDIGAFLSMEEIEGLESWQLPDTEDPNCGHLTIINLGGSWCLAFDFRFNKAEARKHLDAAEEFLAAARFSLKEVLLRAAAENLFNAAELAAKAYILMTPVKSASTSERHGFIHSRFNVLGRFGNIAPDQKDAFNTLSSMRPSARYLRAEFVAGIEELTELATQVADLVTSVQARYS